MGSSLKKYAFINTKLHARISKILPDDLINQMIRAHSFSESIQLLRDTPFAVVETAYTITGDIKMCELELLKKEIDLYRELERFLKGKVLDFVRALGTWYEIENLKIALRLWFDRTVHKRSIAESVRYLYRETIQHDLHVDAIINSENIEEVIEVLKNTPYSEILAKNAEHIKVNSSIFLVEIALDHYFYHQLMKKAHLLDSRDYDIAQRMIGIEIDIHTINWIVRFKNFYNLPLEEAVMYCIPHGYAIDKDAISLVYSSKNIGDILSGILGKKYSGLEILLTSQTTEEISQLILFERILDQIMMNEVRHILSGYPFTIGIILGYFILKRNEIKKVMTILNAKFLGIDENRLAGMV